VNTKLLSNSFTFANVRHAASEQYKCIYKNGKQYLIKTKIFKFITMHLFDTKKQCLTISSARHILSKYLYICINTSNSITNLATQLKSKSLTIASGTMM